MTNAHALRTPKRPLELQCQANALVSDDTSGMVAEEPAATVRVPSDNEPAALVALPKRNRILKKEK